MPYVSLAFNSLAEDIPKWLGRNLALSGYRFDGEALLFSAKIIAPVAGDSRRRGTDLFRLHEGWESGGHLLGRVLFLKSACFEFDKTRGSRKIARPAAVDVSSAGLGR
jgi:hypothetical protein